MENTQPNTYIHRHTNIYNTYKYIFIQISNMYIDLNIYMIYILYIYYI